MSLEAFIDIRLCDPVVALSLNSEGLVYGSMMGRLLYFNFSTKDERVINELSDEFISGAWLSRDNVLYACIGDLRALVISNPDAERYSKQYINFEKIHTSISCELSQIKMHEDRIFIGFLEPSSTSDSLAHTVSPTYCYDIIQGSNKTIEGQKFPPHSVFFDFDGKRLLWMEFESNHRKLQIFTIDHANIDVRTMDRSFGKVGFCKFLGDKIIYVWNQKVIRLMTLDGKDIQVGSHDNYIVALNCVKIFKVDRNRRINRIVNGLNDARVENLPFEEEKRTQAKTYVISVDDQGVIRIWDSEKMAEEILIRNLPQLTERYQKMQYFSLGFPYFVEAYGPRLAISTDLGVLVIRSRELELESQLMR
jgi:hypothetical protein